MITKHLEDAQRDTFAACGLIVIDGEPAKRTIMDLMLVADGKPLGPPQSIAPEGWRILTEPCGQCSGVGYPRNAKSWKGCPNPDCVGGRRVVTLTATCPGCLACLAWKNGHVVTLGRFTIPALLPVVKYGEHETVGRYVVVQVEPGSAGCFQIDNTNLPVEMEELTLDPLPRPGQFIARPERVE